MSALYHRTSYLKFSADRGPLTKSSPLYLTPSPDRRPLTRALPVLLRPLSAALTPGSGRQGPVSEQELALLAHWAAGLQRYEATDAYPLHRAVPAPRCKYTAELHYVSFGAGLLPPGVYRYDPRHHALSETDSAALQAAGVRLHASHPDASDGWLVGALPSRLQQVYGEFAVRLMHLEVGHVTGQLQLLSSALHRQTRWLTLGHDFDAWPLQEPEVPLAAVLNVPGPAGRTHRAVPDLLNASLDHCLRWRHSGHGVNGMYPAPMDLDLETFHALAWRAVPEELRGLVQVNAAVQHVQGVLPGLYTFSPDLARFQLHRPVTPDPESHLALFSRPGFQVRHCPVVLLLSVNTAGPDRFSRPLLAAGLVSQRLSLNAAAAGLFARPSVSHLDAELDALLGFTHTSDTVAYTLLLGQDRNPGFPVRLAL